MKSKQEIISYMWSVIEYHVDYLTDEINSTLLAEDACDNFDDYLPNYDIPDQYFEYSFLVSKKYELVHRMEND